MSATFYGETDWEQSSGPIISRKVHMEANDTTALVWPEAGSDAAWDSLTNGEHPIFALGRKANRPDNVTAVVISYDSATDIAIFNVADKFISRQYVVNIASYTGTAALSWQNTVYPLDNVYVDDSLAVGGAGAGVTLSFSPINDDGFSNPLAGYVFWCQDEYQDDGVAGLHTTQSVPQSAETDTTEVLTLCIMQVNDSGTSNLGTPES